MTDKALQPTEQKQIDFYGDELTAVLAEDGHVYVAIRHMCDALGLTAAPQTRRIKRDEILVDGYQGVTVLVTPGGRQTSGHLMPTSIEISEANKIPNPTGELS